MNNYIKNKIVNLFNAINIQQNRQTLKTYSSISRFSYSCGLGILSLLEAVLLHNIFGNSTLISFFIFANFNVLLAFAMDDQIFHENHFLSKIKNRFINMFKSSKSIKDSVDHIEYKLYMSCQSIENQFLYLSYIDSIISSCASHLVDSCIKVYLEKKVPLLQKAFESENYKDSSIILLNIFTFLATHRKSDFIDLIPIEQHSEYDTKILRVATDMTHKYLKNKNSKTKHNSNLEFEEEKEIQHTLEDIFTKKKNWRDIM